MSETRANSQRLFAVLAAVVVVSTILLGALILQDFNRALTPELERRADLIGATVRDDVERAVGLGIPLDALAGMTPYVEALIEDFPELRKVVIRDSTGAVVHAVGDLAAEADVSHYALEPAGELLGQVEVGVDASIAGSKLQDLALDLAVIAIVALVVIYEVALAVGGRVSGTGRGSRIGPLDVRLVLFVFVIAEELSKSFLPQFILSTTDPGSALDPALAVSLPILAYLLTLGLASPFAGAFTTRFGERLLLAVGLAISALSHLGMVYAEALPQVVALRGLTGVGYAVVTIACLEYLLERQPGLGRQRAMGAFVAVVMGGTFAGTALGGIFADRLGYRPVFAISVTLVVITAVLAWRLLSAAPSTSTRQQSRRFSRSDVGRVLRQPRLMALLAGVTVPMNVLVAAFLWYLVPLTLAAEGDSAAVIGRTLMLYYLAILLCGPIVERLTQAGLEPRILVGVGAMASGLALLIPATTLTTLTVTLAVLIVGVGHAAVRGPQLTMAVEIGDADDVATGRGVTLAAMRVLERLGSLVGLLIAAVIAAGTDLLWAMASVGLAVAVAGAVYLAGTIVARRRLAHA